MNMLQFLFGRAVRARRPHAEILSPPLGQPASQANGNPVGKRNAVMHANKLILCALALIAIHTSDSAADVVWSFTADPTTGEPIAFSADLDGDGFDDDVIVAGENEYEIDVWVGVSTNATGTFRVKLVTD